MNSPLFSNKIKEIFRIALPKWTAFLSIWTAILLNRPQFKIIRWASNQQETLKLRELRPLESQWAEKKQSRTSLPTIHHLMVARIMTICVKGLPKSNKSQKVSLKTSQIWTNLQKMQMTKKCKTIKTVMTKRRSLLKAVATVTQLLKCNLVSLIPTCRPSERTITRKTTKLNGAPINQINRNLTQVQLIRNRRIIRSQKMQVVLIKHSTRHLMNF